MVETDKVRIMMLCQSLWTGGLEHMVVSLASNLDAEQYERSICCVREAGDLSGRAQKAGVEVYPLGVGGGFKFRTIFQLAGLLRRLKIDVLHSHNAGCLLYGAPAARLARVPVVVHTEHGRMLDEFDNKRLNRAERFLSRWVDEIVAVSEPTRETYIKLTQIPRERVQTVENGIDTARFDVPASPRLREDLGIRTADHVIGIVARISEEKDHPTLLRAIARIIEWNANIKLLIVGDGPDREKVDALAKQLQIDHKVVFAGCREDVPALLAIMDIFVLCSKTEGMPLTLLEAMAAGKAIVCTEVGSIPNIIRSGFNGFLVPAGNAEKLGDALLSLIQDRQLRDRFRQAARRDAVQNYSVDKMVQGYEQLYWKHLS